MSLIPTPFVWRGGSFSVRHLGDASVRCCVSSLYSASSLKPQRSQMNRRVPPLEATEDLTALQEDSGEHLFYTLVNYYFFN